MPDRTLMLFTDGSVHPPSRIGYGAYLALSDPKAPPTIQLKRFENTSSSQLEMETLLWALRECNAEAITIYTDSQTIVGLPKRRARIEHRPPQHKPLRHAALYQEFFRLTDSIHCTLIKVKGHQPAHQKNQTDRLFTLVDRASRQALRTEMETP